MASVTIGGNSYELPPLNFKAIKEIWPFVNRALVSDDEIAGLDAVSMMIAIAISRSETEATRLAGEPIKIDRKSTAEQRQKAYDALIESIEEELTASEMGALQSTVMKMMEESGLIVTQKGDGSMGEAKPVEEKPSTGIVTSTSPNSSPQDAAAETGTT